VSNEDFIRQSGLHLKIAEIVVAVTNVAEDGFNDQHKYRYVSEAAFLRALRTEMATRHVTVFPSVEPGSLIVEGRKDGGKGTITTCIMNYTFTDGETGENFTASVPTQGYDTLDKGAFKAMTGAIKYVLRQTFMVPTGEDPEQSGRAGNAGVAQSNGTVQTVPLPEGIYYNGAVTESRVIKKGKKTLWLLVAHVPSSKGFVGEAKQWLDLDDGEQADAVESQAMALGIVALEDLATKSAAAEVETFQHGALEGVPVTVTVEQHGDNTSVNFSSPEAVAV
jgi:hypothetical protein